MNKLKNVIFLDVDYVLNTRNTFINLPALGTQEKQIAAMLEPDLVNNFQMLLAKISADDPTVVLSSSWRFSEPHKKVLKAKNILLHDYLVPKRLTSSRLNEIIMALQDLRPTKFLILDDDVSLTLAPVEFQDGHWIRTYPEQGFNEAALSTALFKWENQSALKIFSENVRNKKTKQE